MQFRPMYYSSFSKHYSYLLIAHVLLAMKKKKTQAHDSREQLGNRNPGTTMFALYLKKYTIYLYMSSIYIYTDFFFSSTR